MTVDASALLADNLDIWATAIERKSGAGRGGSKRVSLYGLERLRALILGLAVRGKLVHQDPTEEPASNLLARIEEERRQRIRSGEMKASKQSLNLRDGPFEIPSSWIWLPLGATGNIFSGNSINSRVRATLEATLEGRPFVATKDIGYGLDPIDYENGLLVGFDDHSFNIARANSVFICAEGGSAGRKIAISDREICFGNKLIANEVWSAINPRFVLYVYLSDFFFEQFSREMTGIIGGISRAKFLALAFPLPPLAEQQRIVAKVDELMALCDALDQESAAAMAAHQTLVEALLATLSNSTEAVDLAANWARLEAHFDTLFTTEASVDAFKQTVLDLAVRGKLTEPRRWPASAVELKSVAKLQNGYAFKSEWFSHHGIRLLRNINVSHGFADWGEVAYLPEDMASEYDRFRLDAGDVVLTLDRPFISTGTKVAKVVDADLPALLLQRVGRFKLTDRLIPEFTYLWVCSPLFSGQIDPGRSNGVPHISSKQVESAKIYVPPVEEQRRIVAKVDSLMALCASLQSCIAEASITQQRLADAVVQTVAS